MDEARGPRLDVAALAILRISSADVDCYMLLVTPVCEEEEKQYGLMTARSLPRVSNHRATGRYLDKD